MHGFGGPLAMLYRLNGEVLAEADAIAAGIHPWDAGAQLLIDEDALADAMQLLGQRIVQGVVVEALPDRLEDRVGGQFEGFPVGSRRPFSRQVRAKRMPRTRPWSSSRTSSGWAQVNSRT